VSSVNVYLRPVPADGAIPATVWLYPPVLEFLLNRLRLGRPPRRPYVPTKSQRVCPVHDPGLCRRVFGKDGWYCIANRPIATSLLDSLVAQYGAVEGHKTYLAMRHNQQGPFALGAKYDPTVVDVRKPTAKMMRRGTSARAANGGKRVNDEWWR
jgi:hypothetical protein